jgi:streptogramin lyase
MTAQLKRMILGRRSGALRETNLISNRPAVVRHGRLEVDNGLRGPRSLRRGDCDFGGRARVVLGAVMALLAVATTAPAASADPVGQISEFSTGLSVASSPFDVVSGSDGNLWFTEEGATHAIGRITPSGQITEFSAGLNAVTVPLSIAAGADGNLWFTDPAGLGGGPSAIGRITPSGQITEFSSGLGSLPDDITLGADGNLWFTDAGKDAIGRITPSGQITDFSAQGSGPTFIAAGPDGNLWFTNALAAIGRITPSGQITEFSAGLNPGSSPTTIGAGPDGNLWFTDEGTTSAIGRITPSGQITEYSYGHGLNAGGAPVKIAAGPDGNLWFTDDGTPKAIGRITPAGQITEYSYGHGLNEGSVPIGIAAGPDGNLWFSDVTHAIGRIGTGAPPALQAPASLTGAGRQGSVEACRAQWSDWTGYSPMAGLYPFDGYAWLRDGSPVPGQTTATYTPTAGDVGHQLACRTTVTYPLPFSVTANATSAAVTVQAAPPPPEPPTPALSALSISPRMFTLRGRRVGGRCEPPSRSNRGHHPCTRRATLTTRYTLNTTATVTFAIERTLHGRLTSGRCTTKTRSDRHHRRCTRLVLLRTIAVPSLAGANRFTITGAIAGHPLRPGNYRLLATPTSGGRAGNQQQAPFQIAR